MFIPIGIWNGAQCVYSRGSTDINVAIQQLHALRTQPWIWFFDCTDLKTLDMRDVQRLATTIREEHATALRQVWILNCTTWMRSILRLFGQERVQAIDGRIETVEALRSAGCPHDVLESVIASMVASPVTKPVRR